MKSIKKWYLSTAFGVALMCAPAPAFALHGIYLPSAGGKLTIGMVSNAAWAGFQPSGGGACLWYSLGGSAGLNSNVFVSGTSGADTVFVFASNTTQCNSFTFKPIKLNGFHITVAGGAGDDLVSGKVEWVSGEDGHDILSGVGGFTFILSGQNGNDTHFAGGSEDLFGVGGDDIFCTLSGANPNFDGGPGYDIGCGPHSAETSMEEIDSPACATVCSVF
jgi:hypothetical protein